MAFYTLEEALKATKDPVQAGVIKTYMLKNPLSNILKFDDADDIIYKWLIQEGFGGEPQTREINGNFNEGTGTKTDVKTVQLAIYNEVRKIDRIIAQYKGNLLDAGIVQTETQDMLTALTYKSLFDFINADSANGSKYDGLIKLAVLAGMNYTVDEGGVAAELNKDNIYDNFAMLQDETLGEDGQKVFLMSKRAFTKVNKFLKLAGMETTIATDDFGRPYATFRSSLLIPMGSYVVNAQGGSKTKIDLLPTATFDETEKTERILCVSFGENYVHAVRGNKGTMVKVKDVDTAGPAEHPTIDIEDTMAIVDKANGQSVAVLEGIIM